MRSELVYSAGLKIENRFLLSATVMRAVRKLHVSSGRTEDTVNRVFAEVAEGRYVAWNCRRSLLLLPSTSWLLLRSCDRSCSLHIRNHFGTGKLVTDTGV